MTGSSASANTQPIQVNTLSSQITQHGNMTIVNSPNGVTMAWEAPANMDVAETSRYMGVNNLRHEVSTDMATGETTSVAYTELTHQEYEAYRNSRQGRSLELPPQPPEKMGNTIGTITFTPAPSGKRAEYANPPEPEPQESNENPNEHLQALIDQNNDKRSLWQRTKDGTASAWDSTKRIANASWENPGEFGKGLAKGIGNLPSDIANLAVEGIKSGGGFNPLNLNNYAKFLDYQAMSAYEAGNIAQANSMANQANSIREFGNVGDIFELKNDAQKGGAFSSIFIPLGTLVKAGAGASKIVKAEKALDTENNTTKTANIASDTAKTGEAANASKTTDAPSNANKATDPSGSGKNSPPDGPNGNGGKVKYRRPKKRVKCFCVQDNAKGGRDEYNRQLKKQQEGINSMSASDYLAERRAFTGKDPCNGYKPIPGGKTKFRNPTITKDAKTERLRTQSEKYAQEFLKRGRSVREADKLGEAKAKLELSKQDPLHNQDMVAAGEDAIGWLDPNGNRQLGNDDFGLSDTNRHIGSQWNGPRIKSIDAEACQMNKSGLGNENLNVELRPCGKHEAKGAGCKQKRRKS
jgi:hypothetical protein